MRRPSCSCDTSSAASRRSSSIRACVSLELQLQRVGLHRRAREHPGARHLHLLLGALEPVLGHAQQRLAGEHVVEVRLHVERQLEPLLLRRGGRRLELRLRAREVRELAHAEHLVRARRAEVDRAGGGRTDADVEERVGELGRVQAHVERRHDEGEDRGPPTPLSDRPPGRPCGRKSGSTPTARCSASASVTFGRSGPATHAGTGTGTGTGTWSSSAAASAITPAPRPRPSPARAPRPPPDAACALAKSLDEEPERRHQDRA